MTPNCRSSIDEAIDALHLAACRSGETSYVDPATGYHVFTAVGHLERGACCGSGCRHCPWGHEEVAAGLARPRDPWVEGQLPSACDVLFFSGGKDSYLTLRRLQATAERPVVLLTTFDQASGVLAHQRLSIEQIREQAQAFGCALLLTPLFPGADYIQRVELALHLLSSRAQIARLAFGDLHLEHIRQWREEALGPLCRERGWSLHFPLWREDYGVLADELENAPVRCSVSAVEREIPGVAVGDTYDASLRSRLPADIDAFGENGEFHTWVQPART